MGVVCGTEDDEVTDELEVVGTVSVVVVLGSVLVVEDGTVVTVVMVVELVGMVVVVVGTELDVVVDVSPPRQLEMVSTFLLSIQ